MVRFRIPSMTCSGCAKGVTATLKEAGVGASLRFDLEHRELEVDAEPSEPERLKTALTTAGWQAELVAS